MMPSLYVKCSAALRRLQEHPPADQGGVFTDHDVVLGIGPLSPDELKLAMHEANNLCGQMFRARKLCRYGPIELPSGEQDYGRVASRIVYADAVDGPDFWITPNGSFPKLMSEDDQIARPGRRVNSIRNDLAPWEDQDVYEVDSQALRALLSDRDERIRELERRLRLTKI